APSSLHPPLAARHFDQDSPHRLGRRGEEMAATLPARFSQPRLATITASRFGDQSKISLMDQGCGLERLARLLVRQLLGGQFAKLVVHQRQKLLRGKRVPLFELIQNPCDFAHASHVTLAGNDTATSSLAVAHGLAHSPVNRSYRLPKPACTTC